MLEFAKKLNFDLDGVQHPQATLIIKTDDAALIAAITDTVRRFNDTPRVIEEATIPAEDAEKLVVGELNLFTELPEDNNIKASRNAARRSVEVIFEGMPQTVRFKTLGELYLYMTGLNSARAGKPATHIHRLNAKRLPNRPQIVNILRMDRTGREYTPTARKAN